MAGRNQRTLNPKTAFWGDARFTASPKSRKRSRADKFDTAKKAFAVEWPEKEFPFYGGCAFDVYEDLADAGWIYSTRYGWRKDGKTPDEFP